MVACAVVAHGETISAEAVAVAVDTRSGTARVLSPNDIGYSPSWCGVVNEGAYVVIEKVEHAETPNAVTSVVTTCAADAEGAYSYSLDADGEPCVRFIHRVYSEEGNAIGDPLVRDMAFGFSSNEGSAAAVDCRANSLREAAGSGAVSLAYSTAWATNAASLAISAIRLSGEGGAETATNEVFSVEADAEGATPMRGLSHGWWRLRFYAVGDADDVLLEYLTDEFKMPGGFVLIYK